MTLFRIVAAALLFSITTAMSASLYDVPVKDIDENDITLAPYQGKVLLIVNVASRCGLTPQYEALEALYRTHRIDGLVVLGFPCNQFGNQEPGTNTEIKVFCSENYDVTFLLFDKIHVNNPDRHPLYDMLAGDASPFPGRIRWNFKKFLIGRDGAILARFEPGVKPDSAEVVTAITAALAEK